MEGTDTTLRFGIMVDSMEVELWQAETVKMLTDNGIILSMVIRNDESHAKQGFFSKVFHYPVRKCFFQVWNHYQFKPECKKRVELKEYIDSDNVEIMSCVPDHVGIATVFSNHDVEYIQQQHLDFILRFGFNILSGSILDAASQGIWSFHHDDEMEFRGAPPGFWEFMKDVPVNGIVLQRLTESLDKGVILKKVFYPTILHSYKVHLNQLYFESETMPLQVCNELKRLGSITASESASKAKVYHAPNNCQMLRYWILCVTRRLRFHLHDVFRQEDWDVAYVDAPIKDFIEDPSRYASQVRWLRRKHLSSYYADPFVITTSKDTYLFFESYDYKSGRGHISAALKSEKFKVVHIVLEKPFHLSYPFVFEYDGKVYCLPEANESNRLTLYRFDEDKLALAEDCVLLDGIKAVDSTLCFRDGKWNLFLTQKDFASVKLYRFIANDLRGPYQAYYNNPVKIDCGDARMAGAFIDLGDRLLRPAQRCVRYYGTAVCLNEVSEMSDDRYSEVVITHIVPFSKSHFGRGLHTLNGNDSMTVFDGKRFSFTIAGMFHQIGLKFKKKDV